MSKTAVRLTKDVVEPQLAEMRARLELAEEPGAFALGMMTAVYLETTIEIPEAMLNRAMHARTVADAYDLWREIKGLDE